MSHLITVLLVDDHAVVREGYKRLLERSGEVAVVGEADSAESAYREFCRLQPHVVVMDVSLPGPSGVEALRRIKARDRDACVLIFSMYDDVIFVRRALAAGATGYLTKASAPDALVAAIRAVASSEPYLSPDIAEKIAATSQAGAQAAEKLSPREHEVLRLWMLGHGSADIASLLKLSQKTIANLQTSIKQKLRAETSAQVFRNAIQIGLAPESVAQPNPEGRDV